MHTALVVRTSLLLPVAGTELPSPSPASLQQTAIKQWFEKYQLTKQHDNTQLTKHSPNKGKNGDQKPPRGATLPLYYRTNTGKIN